MPVRAGGIAAGFRYASTPTFEAISPQPSVSSVSLEISDIGDITATISGLSLDLVNAVTGGGVAAVISSQSASEIIATGINAYEDGARFGLSLTYEVSDGTNTSSASDTVPQPSTVTGFGVISGYDALSSQSESAYFQVSASPAVEDGWYGYVEDRNALTGFSFAVATGLYSSDEDGAFYVRAFNPAGTGIHGEWTVENTVEIFETGVYALESISVSTFPALVLQDQVFDANSAAVAVTGLVASTNFETAISAATEAITVTANAASVQLGASIQAEISRVLVTENTASLTLNVTVPANLGSIESTTYAANIAAERVILAATEAVQASGFQGSVSVDTLIRNANIARFNVTTNAAEITSSIRLIWSNRQSDNSDVRRMVDLIR